MTEKEWLRSDGRIEAEWLSFTDNPTTQSLLLRTKQDHRAIRQLNRQR